MRNKRFPSYPDDADYTTNAPSYYEDLARKEKLIRLLAERIWGYEEILDETLEEIQKRFIAWDKNLEDLPEDLKILLQSWLDNGTLDHIINETIFNWKLDTVIFEQFRDVVTTQLNEKQTVISIRGLGATGDGISDDTSFFVEALEKAETGTVKHIYVEDGTYLLTVDENTNSHLLSGVLEIPDDTFFEMAPNAKLKVKSNASSSYNLLTVNGAKNVTIKGGQLIGDRYSHTGTTGEWGYGIALLGSKNTVIEDVRISDMWGDGVNLQYSPSHNDCEDITINRVLIKNSRRNGISVESAKNVTISNSTITDTKGIAPQCGIDVEPWTVDTNCENVTIENCTFERNTANHILLHNNKSGISVLKNYFYDSNEYAIYALNDIKDLIISDNVFSNSGVWQVDGGGTQVDNKTIIANNVFKKISRTMRLARNTLFTNNIVRGGGEKIGLVSPSEKNIEVSSNTFINADYGVYVNNKIVDDCVIKNNTFSNVITCIQIDNNLANRSKNVVISNNVLSGFSLSALNIKGLTGFVIANNIIKSERLTNVAGYYYGILLSGINNNGLIANNQFLANSLGIKLRYGIYSDNADNPKMRLVGNVLKGGVTTKDGEVFMVPNTDVEKHYNVVTE